MGKGEDTNRQILAGGVREASRIGLTHLTIGSLATALDMSKSGLYAHFGSKEKLQLDILDFAADHFTRAVILPALQQPAGQPRLRTLIERWMGWSGGKEEYALPGGCLFAAAASELDDSPDGPVRDRLADYHAQFMDVIRRVHRSAVTAGDVPDTDDDAFAHHLYALMLGHHFGVRMMRDPLAEAHTWAAVERLLA
ncbi:TetR/AcrR family transcriptional regulator [Ammonicoccus fulvus]|uniref:TetR/AcrR family transcriptional regulator n=1 Tax=Ammonicoccus fulvus TaxID=3138240 RepID=A0ABZ3FJN3_9ACTN